MRTKSKDEHVKELWKAFEKTGSLSAYVLFCAARKKAAEKKKQKVSK